MGHRLLLFIFISDICYYSITYEHLKIHYCIFSIVATDALVLKHQAISIIVLTKDTLHSTNRFVKKYSTFIINKIRKLNKILKKKWPSGLRVKRCSWIIDWFCEHDVQFSCGIVISISVTFSFEEYSFFNFPSHCECIWYVQSCTIITSFRFWPQAGNIQAQLAAHPGVQHR